MRKSDDHAIGADEESLYWHDGRKHVVWWHPGRAAEIRLTVFHDLNDIGVSRGMAAVPGRGILTQCHLAKVDHAAGGRLTSAIVGGPAWRGAPSPGGLSRLWLCPARVTTLG